MTQPVAVAVHGKDYFVSVDGKDLTQYVKTSSWESNPDIHDTTGSGTDDKTSRGGQVGRTFTMGGWFDSEPVDGPMFLGDIPAVTVPLIRRVAGTGTGLPEQSCMVVVGKYVESQKNDDITQWTCDFTVTGPVAKSVQA